MSQQTYQTKLSSTQAGGAVQGALSPSPYRPGYENSAQIEVTTTATGAPATATAGTLSVRGRLAGAATFVEIANESLVAAPIVATFEGFYVEIEAVSTGFDADKTWTLNLASGG